MVLLPRLRSGASRSSHTPVVEDPPAYDQHHFSSQPMLSTVDYQSSSGGSAEKDTTLKGSLPDNIGITTCENLYPGRSSPEVQLSSTKNGHEMPPEDPPPYSEDDLSSDPLAWTPFPSKFRPGKSNNSITCSLPSPRRTSHLTHAHREYIRSLLASDILPELYDSVSSRNTTVTLLLLHPSLVPDLSSRPSFPSTSLSWIPGPTPVTESATHAVHGPLPNHAFIVDGAHGEDTHILRLKDSCPDTQTLTQEWFYLPLGQMLQDRLAQANWQTDLSYLQSYGGWNSSDASEHQIDSVAASLPNEDIWPAPKERHARVIVGPRRVTIRYENYFGLLDNVTGTGLRIRVDFGFKFGDQAI